ncbi:hypothetical protein JCM10914_2432 [Paenibacillus sp. JCM 10914]|nr:hypothetical protein JCM10914_2432 [Paenibacillus sp. JCM 10914]
MTIGGTVNKSFMLLALLIGAAIVSWVMFFNGHDVFAFMIGGAIGGFVLAIIISFAPKTRLIWRRSMRSWKGCS